MSGYASSLYLCGIHRRLDTSHGLYHHLYIVTDLIVIINNAKMYSIITNVVAFCIIYQYYRLLYLHYQ